MKTVQCVVCAFFFFCVLDITKGRDFTDIWRNLPHDFGNAVNYAWNSIVKAIKSPVTQRKVGRRRKKATTTSTTMKYYEILSTSYDFPTYIPRRPTIPIITEPKWRSLLDWRILHRPNLVKLAQEFSNRGAPSMYGREMNSYEDTTAQLTTNDEDNHFEHYELNIEEKEEQSKKISIPVLPTPKYRYDYLWRPKYTSQFVIVPYSTKNPVSRALRGDETFNHLDSQLVTTTEETGSLLKELKFGKYKLKIFYKLLFD